MIERVGIVGGGLMGAGIAEVNARNGLDTVVVEVSPQAAGAARDRVRRSLDAALSRGKVSREERDAAEGRIRFDTDLGALADRDLVIEATTEDETVKLRVFAEVDRILGGGAVLASNTSSIPIVKLGSVTRFPSRVLGVHFFNPVPVMRLVELVPSLTTGAETLARMRRYVTAQLGKEAIQATDRAGFVVNSLLVPYLLSAIRMYEAGYASIEDVDRGMVLGCGHPMGPLALADLIGLDTLRAIGNSLYSEFKEPLYSPPPLLDRMVEAGLVGTKSGHGFHTHH